MPVFIKVTQNKIKDSKSYGKWYGRVATTKTMTYQELCKHMSEHNSVYGEDVCLGVANKLQNCMLEQLLEGKKVQFGELGVFYLSVKSTGANKEEDFNLGAFLNVKDMVESKTKPSSTTPSTDGDASTPSTDPSTNGGTSTPSTDPSTNPSTDPSTGSGSGSNTDPDNPGSGGDDGDDGLDKD